ncbi:MAG: transposase [Armatimonadetes bacterium]|nr:transposase [Armatimonadota bacterium]
MWARRASRPRKRGPHGYDGVKRLCGRKRMTLCDAGGNWLESVVLPANVGERAGALLLLERVKAALWSHNPTLIWVDEGFCVQRKRWLVEQLFGCWGRYRRLSRDYEQNPASSRATLQVASLHRWIR